MKTDSFVRLIHENWELLTTLYSEVKDQSFSERTFVRLSKEISPSSSLEFVHKSLENLKREGLIEPVPRSSKEYEFHGALLLFIEALLNEQKLSLHSELVVRIEELNNLRGKLEKSIVDRDIVSYHRNSDEMDRLLRILKGQIDDSMHAVFRLVEEAKLFPKTMSLKNRYAKTLDAWDKFVNPVLEMCSPTDPFSHTIARIENSLLGWLNDEYSSFLSLDSDILRIEVIYGRLLDFQSALTYAVDNMGKALYPIVKAVRLNTSVTRGATYALRLLERESPKAWVGILDVGITKTKSIVRHGSDDFLQGFMLTIRDYANKESNEPMISNEEINKTNRKTKETNSVTQHEIVKEMRKKLPLKNAMTNIMLAYPEIDLKTLVNCFAKLSRTDGFKISRDDDQTIEIPFGDKILSFKNRNIVKR